MSNKLQTARLASAVIESYYIKLRELTAGNNIDDPEYEEIIDKLKKFIQNEDGIYAELSDEEITKTIEYLNKNNITNLATARMYAKLSEHNRNRNNLAVTTELGNIISSKIIIDVLKTEKERIMRLVTLDISDEEIENLLLYLNIYKFNYLTQNSFIERLALEYKFDLDEIPTFSLNDIEKQFHVNFISKSADLFLSYIMDAIKELLNANTDDKFLYFHITLFEVSRVEVMLPYLNKENLKKLALYLSNLNVKENDLGIIKIKKLVNKRKEEFEI